LGGGGGDSAGAGGEGEGGVVVGGGEQRASENFLWPRAEAIRGALIHEHGLLWALVRQAEGIAAQVGDGGTQ